MMLPYFEKDEENPKASAAGPCKKNPKNRGC
jgi:hypothetical protein